MDTEGSRRKTTAEWWWRAVLFPFGAVTLMVLVVWTIWITYAVGSVWWGRVFEG